MDSNNSGSYFKVSDLDDFLAPAQDGVVQLMTAKKSDKEEPQTKQGAVQIEIENDWNDDASMTGGVRPDLIKKSKDNVATITLADCLACNGCVTTAETMLIQQHSINKFEELLSNCKNIPIVVSISQQSLYSLGTKYNTTPDKMFQVLTDILKEKGVSKVYDTSLAQYIALTESFNEFMVKFKQSEKYSEVMQFIERTKGMSDDQIAIEASEFKKKIAKISSNPVLGSEGPGWVGYAEKVVGELAIPYMSVVKSPQQIQGYLLKKVANKKLFSKDDADTLSDIMHVGIMPCYDKKLEAVRPAGNLNPTSDISNDSIIKEVDAVLATHEMCDYFDSHSIDIQSKLTSLSDFPNYDTFDNDITESSRISNTPYYSPFASNQNSNGYTEFIFRSAISSLMNDIQNTYSSINKSESITQSVPSTNNVELEYKQVRNKDFHEVTYEVHGVPVLKFALAYGFRNIQNIIRNVKRGKSNYDYVEIMAGPGGGLNGGGQVKPKELGMSPGELLDELKRLQKETLEIVESKGLYSGDSLYANMEEENVKEMITTSFSVIKAQTSISTLKW